MLPFDDDGKLIEETTGRNKLGRLVRTAVLQRVPRPVSVAGRGGGKLEVRGASESAHRQSAASRGAYLL